MGDANDDEKKAHIVLCFVILGMRLSFARQRSIQTSSPVYLTRRARICRAACVTPDRVTLCSRRVNRQRARRSFGHAGRTLSPRISVSDRHERRRAVLPHHHSKEKAATSARACSMGCMQICLIRLICVRAVLLLLPLIKVVDYLLIMIMAESTNEL